MKITKRLSARLRAFKIWQKTGNGIWVNTRTEREQRRRGFFHGAFDSIPFLNDDAKRTFVHLMLRPGYMIRDYISGKYDKYMAPIAALIIFYSFLAMVTAVVNPDLVKESGLQVKNDSTTTVLNDTVAINLLPGTSNDSTKHHSLSVTLDFDDDEVDIDNQYVLWGYRTGKAVWRGYVLLNLNEYPEQIDTRWKASLAAFEAALSSQGVTMFIGDLLLLWAAIFIGLRRKYGIRLAAAASMAAYMLCQICFLRMFTLLFTLGHSVDAGLAFAIIVLVVDYHQILNVSYKRSIWLSVKTGLLFTACFLAFVLSLVAVVALVVK
ncbi:MAG: DUF3667 domain-containing protein [Salinivirgaceae bacterium]|nr:DUF3667 domain-containing protein [Salinivirgaceae bacterium]